MKSMFTSRTFWVNVLSAILAVLALPEVNLLPSTYLPYIGAATAVINVILRRLTIEPAQFISPGDPKTALRSWVLLVLSLGSMAGTIGCALSASAPAELSTEAARAFRNTQIIRGLDLLRDTAVDAHAQSLLSEGTTRKVVMFHESTLKIIDATNEGWMEAMKQSLSELAAAIPERERPLLGPYLGLTRTLLKEVS